MVHRGGDLAINYINIFQNDKDLKISVGNNFSEVDLMHNFSENFQKRDIYSDQIASHQEEFRGEENIVDQKSLSLSALHIDYLHLNNPVRDKKDQTFLNQGEVFV